MPNIKPIQIDKPNIAIEDDGTSAVNKLPITITQPTTVFTGTLDELNQELADAQTVLEQAQKVLDTQLTILQGRIDNAQTKVDNIQAIIDQVSPQMEALPARPIKEEPPVSTEPLSNEPKTPPENSMTN